MLKKTLLLRLALFLAILPFNFFDQVWIPLLILFAYLALIYFANKIILTKALHKRSFSELRDSRRMLKYEGFVVEQRARFGNLSIFSYEKYNAHEFVTFQIRESGFYVRTLESINFAILFENISKIEITDISQGIIPEYKKFNCFMRIFAEHEEKEEFLFRFYVSEEFIHWLLPFYNGELAYKSYEEFRLETEEKLKEING